MRYRLMATYLGVPYHAGLGPDGTEVTLFSPGPPPEELGFQAAAGHWRKRVGVSDLQALWQSRLIGEYGGEPCLVLEDLGDRLHIVYLGRDAVRARQLGYWEIDREVFEVVVARDDVASLTEERVEFPLSAATFPSSSSAPRAGAGPAVRRGSAVGRVPAGQCVPSPQQRARTRHPDPRAAGAAGTSCAARGYRAPGTKDPDGARGRSAPGPGSDSGSGSGSGSGGSWASDPAPDGRVAWFTGARTLVRALASR